MNYNVAIRALLKMHNVIDTILNIHYLLCYLFVCFSCSRLEFNDTIEMTQLKTRDFGDIDSNV